MNRTLKILIISKKYSVCNFIEQCIEQTNFALKEADSYDSAYSIIDKYTPDIIFCELSIAKEDNGIFFKEIRKIIPQTIINIILEKNDNNSIFSAMSFGINNYIIFPIKEAVFVKYLNNIECILKSRFNNNETNTITDSKTVTFTISNSFDHIQLIIEELISLINPLFKHSKTEIQIGLEELIVNAIEHGNLNISFEEKSNALQNGTFNQLVISRQNDIKYKSKVITITFYQNTEYDEWIIKDEGLGFNPCDIPTILDESNIINTNGRGILISRFQFDELEYSEKGTKVRFRRYVPKY